MKQLIFVALFFYTCSGSFAQYVYTIKADSVKITACDSAELIIENHTQHIPGFLYNTGNGRTEFRRGLVKVNDSLYIIGSDSLKLKNFTGSPILTFNNGVRKISDTVQFGNELSNPYGGAANQIRPTIYNQNGQFFNWMSQNTVIPTFSKVQYSAGTDNNPLKGHYIARFAAINQGGILFESSLANEFSAPLSWINFKNTHPNAVTTPFFGDQLAGQISIGLRQGTDGKIYHNFKFLLGNDTTFNNQILALQPTYTSTHGGPIRIPSVIAKRLVVDPQIPNGGADNYTALMYNNPYSRLVIEAANVPVVFGNLPQSDVSGRILIIDNEGKVWKGDSTSVLSGGSSFMASSVTLAPQNAKMSSDQQSNSVSIGRSNDLSFNVSAGQYYRFKFFVVFRSSSTSNGIKLGLSIPSSEVFSANGAIPEAADGINSQFRGTISSSGDVIISRGVEAANTDYFAVIEGVIQPSESGTVNLLFGSATKGNRVSIRKGSSVEVSSY